MFVGHGDRHYRHYWRTSWFSAPRSDRSNEFQKLWYMYQGVEQKILSVFSYNVSVLEMIIWIYWSRSNSWINFYIVLNKNWKNYWSEAENQWQCSSWGLNCIAWLTIFKNILVTDCIIIWHINNCFSYTNINMIRN